MEEAGEALINPADISEQELQEQETQIVTAINQAIKSAGHLTNLLPTGTVLFFQFLLPMVSNAGKCDTLERIMTAGLLLSCALSCFLLSFTDTFRAPNGKLYHGIATTQGLYVPQLANSPANAAQYKMQAIDFVHAFLSVAVFAAASLSTPNVKDCFFPSMPAQMQNSIPLIVGFVASFFIILFPSKRRGFDEPIGRLGNHTE